MTEDQILVHTMTFKPKENVKLQIKWAEGDDACALIFKRMLFEGESPEAETCYTKSRLGAKFTGILLSDENIPQLIHGLIKYLKDKKS